MKYLLDTNIVSYALRGVGKVNDTLRLLSPENVFISSITEAELWYGVEKRQSEKLKKLVAAFIQPLEVVPFESDSARCYGRLVVELEKSGTSIDMSDAMIAAVAMVNNMTLVTNNLKHFKNIKGINLENWV